MDSIDALVTIPGDLGDSFMPLPLFVVPSSSSFLSLSCTSFKSSFPGTACKAGFYIPNLTWARDMIPQSSFPLGAMGSGPCPLELS